MKRDAAGKIITQESPRERPKRDNGIHATLPYSSEDGHVPGGAPRQRFVTNGRGMDHTLDRDGFVLSTLPPCAHNSKPLAVYDEVHDLEQCGSIVYPLIQEVLQKQFPSCSTTLIFDHVLRNVDRWNRETNKGQQPPQTPMLDSSPVWNAHNDYTVRSGPRRARELLAPHEASSRIDDALRQRFALVNVWVPLKEVRRDPLALLEWHSASPQDLTGVQYVYKHRTSEVYRVMPSEEHCWVYYPNMVPGECIVFKVFDSAEDGRARFAFHTALSDPTSASTEPARESIEFRTLVFFGDLPDDFGKSFVAPILSPDHPDKTLKPGDMIVGQVGAW